MNEFLLGGITVTCLAIGLFFLRYWRSTRDRFFLFLMASFWIEACNRFALSLNRSWTEADPWHYIVRLLSYGLIFWAVLDKNRTGRR